MEIKKKIAEPRSFSTAFGQNQSLKRTLMPANS